MTKGNPCGINTLSVLTQNTGNEPLTMSSREIAELTEKQHAHVIRDIRTMIEALGDDPDLDHLKKHEDSRGYTSEIDLPKGLTLTLIAGYSIKLRKRIIDRWQELEAAVVRPVLPDNLSRLQLIQIALQAEQERLVLEAKADQFKTSVASAIQTLQSILQTEPNVLAAKGFPAFREAQASLAKAPASPNSAPQSKLSTFEFEGCTVRVVTDATGETRFVGKDVCQVLGFRQHSRVIHESCRGEMKYHHFPAGRGKQPHRLLFETDVAALVERSRSPLAGTFWTAVQSGVFAAQGGKAA